MKTVEYTNFTSFIFDGFYESRIYNSDKLYWVNERFNAGEENGTEWDIDYPEFEEKVCKEATELLNKHVCDEIISKIDFVALDSPREYNFRTDRLVLNVEFDEDKLTEFLIENENDFDAYLRANWSSRSGFISFVPNNYEDFFNFWDDEGVSWQVALEYYILRQLCGKEWNPEKFYEIETEYHSELYETADEIFDNCLFAVEN